MSNSPEQLVEIPKEVLDAARGLTRFINLPVGIGKDYSLTAGNVTFDRNYATEGPRDAFDLACMVDYFSDESVASLGWEPTHMALGTESCPDGRSNQSCGPTERPTDFIRIVEPPSKLGRQIRHILYGY